MAQVSVLQFYQDQWGERWGVLENALKNDETQVARRNLFADVETSGLAEFEPTVFPHCYQPTEALRREIPRGAEGLLGFYLMDPASVWIARALDVQAGDQVLDMCAAPGGKSLCLIEALREDGEILANEPSPARRERLMKVIQQYVPREIRDRVRVTGKEGGLFSKSHPEGFDRILVDAPCSGERHLFGNRKEMTSWSASRSQRLAQEQYSLLSGALEAVRPGGTIVYSTCALSRLENDEVLAKLQKKKGERFEFEELSAPEGAERTEFGVQFLPDRLGYGPLFAARFKKK
jgi:16S rRNA C967 or C1407 C5-methylase (RsmB/RsmF family)